MLHICSDASSVYFWSWESQSIFFFVILNLLLNSFEVHLMVESQWPLSYDFARQEEVHLNLGSDLWE
jgi:hypothetical protein